MCPIVKELETIGFENFVIWLISTDADTKFANRKAICETVIKLGKNKILDELERQASNFRNIGEAVSLAILVRDIR